MTARSGGRPAAPRSRAAVILATAMTAALACALAGCVTLTSAGGASATSTRQAAGQTTWMVTRSVLSQLVTDPVVRAGLARSQVYEILRPGQQPLAGMNALPVVTFSALPALQAALLAGQLPAGTRAVLYDPEAWAFTPLSEQRDPAQAASRAAALAHAHGLQLIVAPALNLIRAMGPAGRGPRWQRFLQLRVAAGVARFADVLDLQAQSLERSPASYAQFVRQAAGQARRAHRGVSVLAGLSTNPTGAPVRSRQLLAAIRASRSDVAGYWLNIPGPGARCPACGPPQPGIGIAVLRAVL